MKYRLGVAGVDGGVATYTLYRQDLLRWHHVEQLTRQVLQQRFLFHHGVWAHEFSLERWMEASAQQLPTLENNEDIHSHACGEFALEQLQKGSNPQSVVESLLHEYLVKTTVQRVQAYRVYREQRGDYLTKEKLVQHHWQFLYEDHAASSNINIIIVL